MRHEKPIVCRNCLNKIHKNYISFSSTYPNNRVGLSYFLITCVYFSEIEGFDFDIALNLRPYGGIIGIDKSSVDKYLKISKVLRLHAILNDPVGFVYEIDNQGPGYSFMLPWKSSNCFGGHLSGISFYLYINVFNHSIIHLLES